MTGCMRWIAAVVVAVLGWAAPSAGEQECDAEYSSTFELIQKAVFERNGCTSAACHGVAQAGGLDLREGVSWQNLIDQPSQTVGGFVRVSPGSKDRSLLFLNLAAKTFPGEYQAPLRAMPLDPLPALSPDEVEAIRLWIEDGAPETGVVEGTGELLDACLPPPEPIEIAPLPPPPPGTGVQIHMPRRFLPPRSEEEVCFATYYDVTDQVPPQFRGESGDTFRFRRMEVRQDPLSHHLITFLYDGRASIDDSRWGVFRCWGGDREGEPCDPTDASACGEGGQCATEAQSGVACIGFGPGDAGVGISSAGIAVVQETAADFPFASGVYDELPLRGILLWDSHAFNLTDEPAKLEAWINFEFAPPEEQSLRVVDLFDADDIFAMSVPPFRTQEVCGIHTFPQNAHVFELTSHMHQRGKRFRVFEGAWRCQEGPKRGAPCSPLGYDMVSPDPCPGACAAFRREPEGDCNLDGEVSIDELILAVRVALGQEAVSRCFDADADRDDTVSIAELITAVRAAASGTRELMPRDPEGSLFYVNFLYDDPLVIRPEPPLIYRGTEDDRSVTFCALYDNGYTDPSEVKTRSGSPPPPLEFPGIGGPCVQPTHCTAGRLGEPCSGTTLEERHASCDSTPGAGDGVCDACPLLGGVTTEDEMFILIGHYFVP